jgi:anti-sigma regulatory factor (Ser/Thr protein kinase)
MTDPTTRADFRHLALFYRGRGQYQAAVGAFAKEALQRGEPVLVAVPSPAVELVRVALGADAQRVSFADMTQMGRNPAWIIPVVRAFADRHAGERFSFVGESAWPVRSAPELVEAVKHEALVNLAFGATPATFLCPYNLARLPRDVITGALCTHPMVVRRGRVRANTGYLGPYCLPPRCEEPLPPPPPAAERLSYDVDLRPVRALVARWAARCGLPESRSADLVLAVSEVAANTLRHTPAGGTVDVWSERGEIVCEVHDRGWILDPLAGRRRPLEDPPGGQGLWLVNQVCDLVEIRSGGGGTTVRMHMGLGWGARGNGAPGRLAAVMAALRRTGRVRSRTGRLPREPGYPGREPAA